MWASAYHELCNNDRWAWRDIFGLVLGLTECFPPKGESAPWYTIGSHLSFLFATRDPASNELICGPAQRGVTLFVLLRHLISIATECDTQPASATALSSLLDYGAKNREMLELVGPLIAACPGK